MNTRSLRFQLLAWYISLLIVAFAAVALFMSIAVKQLLLQNLRDLLGKRARQIAHITTQARAPLTSDWLRAQIAALYAPETPESNGRFVRVASEKGQVLFQSGIPADGSFDPAAIPLLPYKDGGFRTHKLREHEILVRSARSETGMGSVVVEVGGSTSSIRNSVRQILLVLAIAAPCLIAIAAIGAYFLIGRALRPMMRLAQSAEAISHHNLNERLPMVETSDELETLSRALNRMITRIHDAVENTRRFVADASHELRTPLAVLRAELESVSAQQHHSREMKAMLESNLEEVERLGKIVQGLFALSRLDCGEAQAESIVFDLSRVAATTAEQMCLLAEDKGISLVCETAEPAFIRGDPARIKQILVNLLDNAINYTPEGGNVRVKTRTESAHVFLQVQDNGVGIPQSALPHIFERFYRVDKARSREMGGAGLGLSIVKAICGAHEAEIKVQSSEGAGTKFEISFPCPQASN